jgi:hypothetical protein
MSARTHEVLRTPRRAIATVEYDRGGSRRYRQEHQVDHLKESVYNQDNQDNDADNLVDSKEEYH